MARPRTRKRSVAKPRCTIKWRKTPLGWTAVMFGWPRGHVLNVINLKRGEAKPKGTSKKRFEKALLTGCSELYVPRSR